jgi:hypothetical protein
VNDRGWNAPFSRPNPEVSVGCRDHGITGTEKNGISVERTLKQIIRVLLYVLSLEQLEWFLIERFELFFRRPHKPGCIILEKDVISIPYKKKSLIRNIMFIVETKADKGEHSRFYPFPGLQ